MALVVIFKDKKWSRLFLSRFFIDQQLLLFIRGLLDVAEGDVVILLFRKSGVQELDEAERLRISVDQAQGVGHRRGRQQLFVLVFGLVGRKPTPAQVPVFGAIEEQPGNKIREKMETPSAFTRIDLSVLMVWKNVNIDQTQGTYS